MKANQSPSKGSKGKKQPTTVKQVSKAANDKVVPDRPVSGEALSEKDESIPQDSLRQDSREAKNRLLNATKNSDGLN